MRRPIVFLALCLSVVGPAVADELFDFTYSDGTFTGIGTLTATPNGDGSFTADSGSGIFGSVATGYSAMTLIPNGAAPDYNSGPFGPDSIMVIYDDQLFPSGSSYLDGGGLLFGFTGAGPLGATEINICGTSECTTATTSGPSQTHIPYGFVMNDSNATSGTGNFTLVDPPAAVPEPSSLVVVVGASLLLLSARRKRASR